MLKQLGLIDLWEFSTATLRDIASEELWEDNSPNLHVVIHNAEIPTVLNDAKARIRELWLCIGWDQYSGASIVRSVTRHTDLNLSDEEAFALIVTHVEGGVHFYVWDQAVRLSEWQILYFDPHILHGVMTDSPRDNATVVRITVKKIKNPPK
jgi:hypothetical protein